jgi:hypothetical protein
VGFVVLGWGVGLLLRVGYLLLRLLQGCLLLRLLQWDCLRLLRAVLLFLLLGVVRCLVLLSLTGL